MGVEKREKTVEELYDVTEVVLEPKITPVLRGRYCMKGPVQESDDHIVKDMISPGLEKEFGTCSMNQEFHMRGESGTCNVCSAPCSSCMHRKRAKIEEFSEETFHVNASSQCSTNEADASSFVKSRAFAGLQNTDLQSVNSSQDYSPENADSRAPLRSSNPLDSSEDAKMFQKFTGCGLVGVDDVLVKSAHQGFSSNKSSSKGVEGHGDNISCISGSGNSTREDGYNIVNLDRQDLLCRSASSDCLSPGVYAKTKSSYKLCTSETPVAGDVDTGSRSLKAHRLLSHFRRSKSLSGTADDMDVERLPLSETKREQHESSMQHGKSFTKEFSPGIVFGQRSLGNKCVTNGSNSMDPMKRLMKSEKEGEPANGSMNSSAQEEQDEKLNKLAELSDLHEPSSQVASGNESDDSDTMEHDVKVCDICGDAGREDMLAICSRCTDGAEHVYCMREALPSVPEGDWWCEECSLIEGVKNKKPDDETERGKEDGPSQRFFDAQDERTIKKRSAAHVSGEKHTENVDATSTMKRQTFEECGGLPKSSSRIRVSEASFKNLDKGKLKPVRQTSFGNDSSDNVSGTTLDKGKLNPVRQTSFGNDSSDNVSGTTHTPVIVPRFQTPKGTFSRSHSFNTTNLQPKVRLVDEYIPMSKKGDREHSHLEIKGGPARMLCKSMSWKNSNSSRLTAAESKVKMLSSKFIQSSDAKGLKQVKECNLFERKNLSKLDHSRVSSVAIDSAVLTPKVDQKFTSPGDSNSSVSVNRDIKPVQSERTSNTFKKSSSSLIHRGADTPVSPGGALSKFSSGEQKLNILSPKEEPSSCSLNAGRPSYYDNGLLRSPELVNHDEKKQEACQSKPSVINGAKGASCKHVVNDVCSRKSSKEDTDEGNKLKAAIQAAMLKRPEIYRKKRILDSCDDVAPTSTELQGRIASYGRLIPPQKFKNEIYVEGAHGRQDVSSRSITDLDKRTCNEKQLGVPLNDGSSPIELLNSESFRNTDENLVMRDLPLHSSVIMSFHLNLSGIPEHEYTWQGSFEVHKAGKHSVLHDGIQAHRSISASPKVLEVVKKFPYKIIFDEVPRMNTWPSQFHDCGVKEDNIALFIFAKDIESYERSYKSLLGNMISNDLALKANLGDVEFLVFPSNHLPEKSQRWNTLFFLWGLFRGRRMNCADSLKKFNIPCLNDVPLEENIATSERALSERRCLPKHMDSEPIACSNPCVVLASTSSPSNLICDQRSRNFCSQESFFQQTHKGSQTNYGSNLSCNSLSGREMACSGSLYLGSSSRRLDEATGKSTVDGKVHSQDISGDQGTPLIIMKDEHDENMAIGSTSDRCVPAEGVNSGESNNRKRGQEPAASTSYSSSQMSLNERNVVMMGENGAKKPRTDYGFSTSYSGRYSTSLQRSEMGLHSLTEKNIHNLYDENDTPGDSATSERYFFPVESHRVDNFQLGTNCMKWNTQSTIEEDKLSIVPNLNLALGAETKPSSKAVLPFFLLGGEKHNQTRLADKVIGEKEDDSESLSLSLSFPFPEKEKAGKKTGSKTERMCTKNRSANPPFLLFDGISKE